MKSEHSDAMLGRMLWPRIRKRRSILVTGLLTLLTALWWLINALSNLDFVIQKRAWWASALNFLLTSQAATLFLFLAIVALLAAVVIEKQLVPKSLSAPPADQTELEIRFEFGDSRYVDFPYYRIGIYNCGSQVARRVEVILEAISPDDYAFLFDGQLPHPFRTRDGNERHCDINPDREELFGFVTSSRGERDAVLELAIDNLRGDPARNRNADSPNIVMRPREYLHFYLRVCCANANSQTVVFFARRWDEIIEVSRIC